MTNRQEVHKDKQLKDLIKQMISDPILCQDKDFFNIRIFPQPPDYTNFAHKNKIFMMKTIYSFLSAMIILALSACSSDPFVGEWMPSNDTSGNSVIDIKSDGTMAIITDTDDGYGKISGSWTRVSDSENKIIKVKLNANTIELDFDNPLLEVIAQQVLQEYADAEATLVLSEDGNSLLNKSSGIKAYIRK